MPSNFTVVRTYTHTRRCPNYVLNYSPIDLPECDSGSTFNLKKRELGRKPYMDDDMEWVEVEEEWMAVKLPPPVVYIKHRIEDVEIVADNCSLLIGIKE